MGIMHGFIPQDTDEKDVIEIITSFKDTYRNRPDLTLFYNLLYDPVRQDGIEEYRGFYVAKNILREELQFDTNSKPGDFDIIFIPFNDEKLFYDRTAVFEVKIARPYFDKPNKNSNSLGETQLKGLIEDGFPLVGLLHVCTPFPLSEKQASWINVATCPVNIDGRIKKNAKKSYSNKYELQRFDWLPTHAIHSQMKRLITAGFPKYVGINAFALTKNPDGRHNIHSSFEYKGYTSGYFNPQKKERTVKSVENHFLEFGTKRYTKLEIW